MSERWVLYVLECRDGSLYTGVTNRLPERLARHAAGKGAAYTRSRLPIQLVFSRAVKDRGTALSREAAFKRLSRTDKLRFLERPAGRRLP